MATISTAMPRRSQFVTVMAVISIVLGIVGTAYGLLQMVVVTVLLDSDSVRSAFAEIPAESLPPFANGLIAYLPAMGWGFVLMSGAFLAASVGLLKRYEWGRLLFIVFMVVGAAANFVGVWLLAAVFDWLQSLPVSADAAYLQAELAQLRVTSLAMTSGSAVVFAALHGWIVYQLCTRAIRSEFRR
ncbi:hypothetical protein [Pseudoxanthomonas sp. UTMC 1351]|uniref:hypothetical protein n=1 Tax=Pseudoxanthomonas sp. UTMC 1351 TaxID=2695853 RepID=UPI0034CDB77A